jgi:hypothetical protein
MPTPAPVRRHRASKAWTSGNLPGQDSDVPIGSFAAVLYFEGLFRHFENRRQFAAYAGLAPSPWKSGSIDQEQGISKQETTSAYHNGRACLDVGEIPARQCSQLLAFSALSWG